ncbi:MAG: hypothetical protein GY953_35665 [bacterium]|nr:hypothetical protein [bacterium]
MENQTTAPAAIRESHPSSKSEAARFLGRYPARARRIQARVEDERSLLTLALATFQTELAAAAA